MDPDSQTRAAIEEHWRASERGETEAEHAIYAEDAILDVISRLNRERSLTVGLVCHHLPRIRSLVHGAIWVDEGRATKRAIDDLPAIAPLEVAGTVTMGTR